MNGAEPFSAGGLVVFDTSAWNRQRARADLSLRWEATIDRELLTSCPLVALEVLASARNEDAFRRHDATFAALPQAPVTRAACDAALAASRKLEGERRLPATDYLIAAAAAERGAALLHYDRHFDPLCRALGVEGIWLAEPGSLD